MIDHESSQPPTEILSVEQLAASLRLVGIDLEVWGQGNAKTLAHLYKEIIEGESALNLTENGAERRVGVARVDVLYNDQAGNAYRLVEDRQEFGDGRIRRRQLETSLSEKFKVGENPEDAAKRALSEEIGVINIDSFYDLGYEETALTSPSYPGLASIYDEYTFAAVLSHDDFNREGYVETQPDKTNYYVWVALDPTDNT